MMIMKVVQIETRYGVLWLVLESGSRVHLTSMTLGMQCGAGGSPQTLYARLPGDDKDYLVGLRLDYKDGAWGFDPEGVKRSQGADRLSNRSGSSWATMPRIKREPIFCDLLVDFNVWATNPANQALLEEAELEYREERQRVALRDRERCKANYEEACEKFCAAKIAKEDAKDAVLLRRLPKYPGWYMPKTEQEFMEYEELWHREKCVRKPSPGGVTSQYRLPMEGE